MPLMHVVLIKLKPAVSPDLVTQFATAAKAMVGVVPGLTSISTGKALAETLHRGKGYDLGLLAVMEKSSDLKVYADHPAHLIVQKLRMEIGDDAIALDWETDLL